MIRTAVSRAVAAIASALCATALALVVLASVVLASGGVATAAPAAVRAPAATGAAAFSARLHAPNHAPRANRRWWITIDVTRGRSKLSGSVSYEFVYNGTVVGHHAGHRFTRGYFRDWLLFPSTAVGYPLTLRILVRTRYGTVAIPWAVRTRA